MSTDMIRTLVVSFNYQPDRTGWVNLSEETIEFNDGDSYPIDFIMADPNVVAIKFTSH